MDSRVNGKLFSARQVAHPNTILALLGTSSMEGGGEHFLSLQMLPCMVEPFIHGHASSRGQPFVICALSPVISYSHERARHLLISS